MNPTPSLALFLGAVLLPSLAVRAQTPVVFVDARATGANNGTSWRDAYTDLGTALTRTTRGEIWVAAATYRLRGAGATYSLRRGVALLGGFAGHETHRQARDPARNPTILSGDVNGDDGPGWANRRDNATHVVSAVGVDASAVLDGFTVRGGYAIGNSSGAGLWIRNASPSIRTCRITDNLASWGAGAVVFGGAPVFERCDFEANLVHLGRGGALHVAADSSARLVDCRLMRNTVRASAFAGHGGAIYGDLRSRLVLERCQLTDNAVDFRFGGMGYPPQGGAISFLGTSLVAHACRFERNRAPAGGAIYTYGATTLSSCVLAANQAYRVFNLGGYGGAMVNAGRAVSTLQSCVVHGNRAAESGGGILGNKTVTVVDSILWANRDKKGTIGISQLKGTKQRYCCIQSFLTGPPGEDPPDPRDYPGCILLDPRLANPAAGDWRVQAGSPCIDRGDPTSTGRGLDLYGNPRRLDGGLVGRARIDMGAHEFSSARLLATVAPAPGGSRLTLSSSGRAGVLVTVLAGVPAPGTVVDPFGEIFLSLQAPLLAIPLGRNPGRVTLSVPAVGGQAGLQALAVGTLGASLSNPVVVDLP